MKLFDFVKTAQEKVEGFQKKTEAMTEKYKSDPLAALSSMAKAKEIQEKPKQPKEKKQKSNKANSLKEQIISLFYTDYPEIPYISNDRNHEWIEMATTFPKTVPVQKAMMVRYKDGLLPGHVYMLYWLRKYTNKKVPAYFEYKYGINFETEKAFLFQRGFLDSTDKPTEKGIDVILKHPEVIANHAPKPDRSIEGITKQILAARDNIVKNGYTQYEFMANHDCCDVCARLNGKHFPLSKLKPGVNAPPLHEGCRCSIAAWVDSEKYEKWLNSL